MRIQGDNWRRARRPRPYATILLLALVGLKGPGFGESPMLERTLDLTPLVPLPVAGKGRSQVKRVSPFFSKRAGQWDSITHNRR